MVAARRRTPCLSAAFAAVLYLAAAEPAIAGADVVVLRSGASRAGRLASCSAGRCQLDGEPIARAEIAWIGFGQEGGTPPRLAAAAADQVVLATGAVERGEVTGVSLGVVALAGSSIERARVAWIRFADPGAVAVEPAPGAGEGGLDTAVLRDGSVRAGELEGCAGGGCWLAGSPPLARADLAAIAFAGTGGIAPAAGDLAQDRVLLADGGSRDGAVWGVSSEDVVTSRGTFERAAVSAILFAVSGRGGDGAGVVPSPAPEGGGGVSPGGTPPAGPPAAGPPPGVPPPAPPPTPSPAPPRGGARERGALWTGGCRARIQMVKDDCVHVTEVYDEVRLREYPSPLLMVVARDGQMTAERVGTLHHLEPEGMRRTNYYTLDCPQGGASGQGTIVLDVAPDDPAYGHASTILQKSSDRDLTPLLGYDVPRAGGLYVLAVEERIEDTYPVTYRFAHSPPTTVQAGYQPCVGGRSPLLPDFVDPETRSLEGGRMIGRYTADFADATVDAAWVVCREGDACPPPPEPPTGPTDPCDRAGQQQALAATCRAQLDALVASLEPLFEAYNERMAAANANRDAFAEAQRYCQLYDTAQKILEAILTGGGGAAAELAQSLLYLRDVIDKAAHGDLAALLYPPEVKKMLKAYKRAKNAWFELTADDLSLMTADLGRCSGKVPVETYRAAQRFLEDLAAARSLWHDTVAPRINDLRSKGLECSYLDHAAWRACLADAQCRGVPPDCGSEPSLAGAYD